MRNKTVIKKYSDRRLYDSGAKCYVKLEDIARMIRSGVDVQVLDASTGQDLTRVILTQIVMEEARDVDAGLPMQLLRQLVLASDRATHDFLTWYLNGTLDLYKKAQNKFHSGLSEARQAISSPLEFVRHLLPSATDAPAEDAAEVELLRRRVEELEARLAKPRKPSRAAKRRPAAKRRA